MRFTPVIPQLGRALFVALALSACSAENALTPSETVAPQFGKSSWSTNTTNRELEESFSAFVTYLGSLLPCTPETYVKTVKTIGPKGGTLVMGNHRLVVPKGALAAEVTITGEVLPNYVNSVRLQPHGLQFVTPAVLVMNYGNCKESVAAKVIAYTTEDLEIIEKLKSKDAPAAQEVAGTLNHFSRYAVAW